MNLTKDFYEFEYKMVDDYAVITKCICPIEQCEVVFPSIIDGKRVLKIGEKCCDYGEVWNVCDTIIIEEGIEEIGDFAFISCCEMKKIVIPSTVKRIGNGIFEECDNLSIIEIDQDNMGYSSCGCSNVIVEKEDMSLLYGIKTSILSCDIKRIKTGAFHNIKGLETIVVNEGCEVLEENCIYDCRDLTAIIIPSTVQSASKAISKCYCLSRVTVDSQNKYISYDDILKDFVSVSANKASALPLCDFTFNMEAREKGFIEISYQMLNDKIFVDYNNNRRSFRCGSLYREALQDLSCIMGYVSENLSNSETNSSEYHSVSADIRCTYSCKNYANYNKIIMDENLFIKLISILEYLSPFSLNEFRNIPTIKYSIDDVNLEYVTLPDVYHDMFDTYQALYSKKHPEDTQNILIDGSIFSHRDKLKYVKIRQSDCIFSGSFFEACENIKSVVVEDRRIFQNLSDQVKILTIEAPNILENEINDDAAF